MKLIVVTGASKGLGLAICKRLLHEGYKVVGISRSCSQEFKTLQKDFSSALAYEEYDFLNTENLQNLIRKITKEHGNIYGLVNNAALGYDGVLGTMHESQIKELIKVNIESPILLTKYATRSMLMKLEGRVINIGSIIATTGFNGLSVYGATKASLSGFTRSLARELGKANITVNTIAPGYMKTAMTSGLEGEKLESIKRRSPLGRLATVDDVAGAVSYLLSDEAKNITGTTITVDAGSTA
jgi:3-oxoacyl-[acyl-carrier protein] reductase